MISLVIISKDDPSLDETLDDVQNLIPPPGGLEVVVVDASEGRLRHVADRHPDVTWIDFSPVPRRAITIPHQRNTGVRASRGDVIVFTDAGCRVRPDWLRTLVAPILDGVERVTAGVTAAPAASVESFREYVDMVRGADYLEECPYLNMAFARRVYEQVGEFDESFEYGSDADFGWRLTDAGIRIRVVSQAVVEHDWGNLRRRLRRSFLWGHGRAKLYSKHRGRLPQILRRDPILIAYPLFLLGLPVAIRFRSYPLLLLIPAWRNRRDGAASVVASHFFYAAGALSFLARRLPSSLASEKYQRSGIPDERPRQPVAMARAGNALRGAEALD